MAEKTGGAPAAAAGTVPSIAPPVQADDPDMAAGVRKTPFLHPAAAETTIPSAPQLTTEQQTAYNSVLNTVAAWTHVPNSTHKDADSTPITEGEQRWLTRECLLRYLRASKWDITDATTRLQATLAWRREYGLTVFPTTPAEAAAAAAAAAAAPAGNKEGDGKKEEQGKLTAEYISVENETGKQWVLGYDSAGRPCHYLNPSRQNTERSERQIEHLVYMIERDIDLMPARQETLALLINFAETSKGQGATVAQGRQVLSILQAHYPERLGRALLINLPWFFWAFMKLITPFIDPLTRQKLVYNDDLRKHVPPGQLLKTHGGDVEFEYEHAVYWPALNGLAAERRRAQHERWVAAGRRVGEHEDYLKAAPGAESLEESIRRREREEREKRPGPGPRSATTRSGGLKVVDHGADGDEQQQQHQQQRDQQPKPRKSVSIYDDKEGHSTNTAGEATTTATTATAATTTTATETSNNTDTVGATITASTPTLEPESMEGEKEEEEGGQTSLDESGEQETEGAKSPTSPVQVTFTDGKGNPLPDNEGTGRRETSPGGKAPRRVSNPKPMKIEYEVLQGN